MSKLVRRIYCLIIFDRKQSKQLLLNLDLYGVTDPLGTFPHILRRQLAFWVIVSESGLHLDSFSSLETGRCQSFPKGPPSSTVANFRPISITHVLSKVYDHFVSGQLGWFMENRGIISTTHFAYRKCLLTCDALLCVSLFTEYIGDWAGGRDCADRLQRSFWHGKPSENALQAMLCVFVLLVLTQFLSNRSQYVVVLSEVYKAHCSSCTPRSFSLHYRTSCLVTLMTHFGCCGAISTSKSNSCRVNEL